MIEDLIEADRSPRTLIVVSSDHRLHRAARRRGATAVDSERWFADLRRGKEATKPVDGNAKPTSPFSPAEVQYWLTQFGIRDQASIDDASPGGTTIDEVLAGEPGSLDDFHLPDEPDDPFNPFPPGYGDDLLTDEDWPNLPS